MTRNNPFVRSGAYVGIVACALLGLAIVGCGQASNQVSSPTEISPPVATVTAVTPNASTLPQNACKIVSNATGTTVDEIERAHGVTFTGGLCLITVRGAIVLQSHGEPSSDPRPGYMVCPRPLDQKGPYCGVGLDNTDDTRTASYASNWRFYPFPAAEAHEVGPDTPFYVCLGSGSQLWTFHLDTFDYTSGCKVPPDSGSLDACGSFMYVSVSDPAAYSHGQPVACAQFGATIVSTVNGNPQPGFELCAAPSGSSMVALYDYCSLALGIAPEPGHWTFVSLPVPAGPVTGATFDTAVGTACVSVGAQSFTFTLATLSVTSGCAPDALPSPAG